MIRQGLIWITLLPSSVRSLAELMDRLATLLALISDAKKRSLALEDILIDSRQASQSMMTGVHGRRRAGQGENFWQFRDYQPGEPAYRIDWRRSAKGDSLNVRDPEFEAPRTVWFALDQHTRMDWSGDRSRPTKFEAAALMALTLADLLLRQGERVGWLGQADPALRGNAQLETFARRMVQLPPTLTLSQHIPTQGDLFIVIGDFLAEPAHWQEALRTLCISQPDSGCIIDLLDPAERDFPFTGRVTFETVDATERVTIEDAEAIRQTYLERLRERNNILGDVSSTCGWLSTSMQTDQDISGCIQDVCVHLSAHRHVKAA